VTAIAVGSIIWREVTWPHHGSMLRLVQARPDINVLMLSGDALVSRARAIVATRFLRRESEDALLFIDSDIHFDPSDAIRVCEQAHELGGVVGGMYTVRRADGAFPACLLPDGQATTFYDANGPDLVDVEYLSGGFMAISRAALERVVQANDVALLHPGSKLEHHPIFRPFAKGDIELSEDWAFIDLARQAGVSIKLNPQVRLRHIGQIGFHTEDMVTRYPPNGVVRVTRNGEQYRAEMLA
jgi:hypothetical protein